MTRDESLIRFCAIRVMGWKIQHHQGVDCIYSTDGLTFLSYLFKWNPAESWDDMGQVWEKAAKMGHVLQLTNIGDAWVGKPITSSGDMATCDSGPRAITTAIARAFGYQESDNVR